MVEKKVYDYLKSVLDVDVYMEFPKTLPSGDFVTIEKINSSCEEMVYVSMFALQSYSTTMYKASELNEKVKSVMRDIIEIPTILKSDLNADYNYTDTDIPRYRYQAIFHITTLEV